MEPLRFLRVLGVMACLLQAPLRAQEVLSPEIPAPASSLTASRLILVRFKPEAPSTVRHSTRGDFQAELVRRRSDYELWSLPSRYSPNAVVHAMKDAPYVRWATHLRRFHSDYIPNDPYFLKTPSDEGPCRPYQWGHYQVELPRSWDYTRGSKYLIVAVVDGGIAAGHPELAGRIWVNQGEVPGNLLDDDANGYIDDDHGYDFCGSNPGDRTDDPSSEDNEPHIPVCSEAPCDPSVGDGVRNEEGPSIQAPDAYVSHGTLVAGLIAAVMDDRKGFTGMDEFCRIMDIRAGNAEGTAFNVDLVDAIRYAVDNGARVVYLAFGSLEADPAVADAVADAVERGAVVIAPVGNRGKRGVDHPAAMATPHGLLGVAASDEEDRLALFSSFGSGVDLMAPGRNIRGPMVVNAAQATATPGWRPGAAMEPDRCPVVDGGTSLAAAYVAGAAALLLAYDPHLTPKQVDETLVAGCDHPSRSKTDRANYGRLDVLRSILYLQSFTPTPTQETPAPTDTPVWTDTPTPVDTPTVTNSATRTPIPTCTMTGTLTPPDTPTPTMSPTTTATRIPTQDPQDPSVSVFPDPARGKYVTFRFRLPNVSNLALEIYDRFGSPVTLYEKTAEGWMDFTLPTKSLPSGIYTYHIDIDDNFSGEKYKFHNKKFVVIKEK